MAKKQQTHERPEDCPTAWFAVLERAWRDGDAHRAAEAEKELARLGVVLMRKPIWQRVEQLRAFIVERGARAIVSPKSTPADFAALYEAMDELAGIAATLPGTEHINMIGFVRNLFKFEETRGQNRGADHKQMLVVTSTLLRAFAEHARASEVCDG